ncbi:MAG: glycosyltransferase [Chloroflexota bacterium]|nr:glycosyltransferase [Chloroflexota bacterium]
MLFLAHSFPRYAGDAAGSFLLRLARSLRVHGVAVTVVAPAAPGLASIELYDGVRVERYRYAPRQLETLAYGGTMVAQVSSSAGARAALIGLFAGGLLATLRARRRWQPHVLHAHWWVPGGVVGAVASRLTRLPLVTTLHGTDLRLARRVRACRPMFRSVLYRSSTVTTVSSWLAAEVRAMAPACRPVVAPMPVAVELFTPGGTRTRDRLLFVGRLDAQKGLEHLISAVASMRTQVMLDVVGDGPARAALEASARAAGLASRITWHGQRPQPTLADFYRSAAALVVPSIDEGLGLVAIEAMLCCTPVVAANSGGLTDIVYHGRTGVLVPPADPVALAAALDNLLSHPDCARVMGEDGRAHALSAFAPDAVASRYAAIYHSAVAHSSR